MYKRNFGGRRNSRLTTLASQTPASSSRNRDNLTLTSVTANDENDIFSKLGLPSNGDLPSVDESRPGPKSSQKRNISLSKKPVTYFEEVIVKCGIILNESKETLTLSKDQALFVKELECELKKHLSYPSNIDEFISGFEKHVSTSDGLKKALAQTKTSDNCTMARSMQQDSLVRLLLLTTELQPKISKLMLEKAAEFALSSMDDMGSDLDEAGWVRLILSQFRLLDFVVDGDHLANQLIEILQAAPESVQQEVIFFMPQIISDNKHQEAAESLSKMLHENFSLTPGILDVLSQLNIGSILRAQVCEEMLDALRKAPVEFLPSIVAFVLSEAELSDLEQVTARLRVVLDLTPTPVPSVRGAALSQRASQSVGSKKASTSTSQSVQTSFEVLTLEAIAMRFKVGQRGQRLVDTWLGSLEAVKSADDHHPLDFLIILVLLDVGNGVQDGSKEKKRRKKVESLLKAKVKGGLLTEELLEKTFSTHPSVLREYFRTVMLIASLLLSSRELVLLMHGAAWLRLSFVHLAEHLRPSVLGELIMHTAIGKLDTANVMLQTLHSLSHQHYEKLAPLSVLLLGLLEKVEDMDIEQVRDLMDTLCFLAFCKDDHGSGLRSDITILIRKHLSSSNIQLKRKGVIGATMAVKHMASLESECNVALEGSSRTSARASSTGRDSQSSEDSLVPGSKAANAVMFLELVLSTCGCYAEVIGLLYDQLSCMAMDAELDEKFMEWIAKTMTFDFQDSFIEESTVDFPSSEDLPLAVLFGLDTDLNNTIALKLTPLVAQREERLGGPRVSFGGRNVDDRVERPLEVMNPLLRLMRILRFRLEEGDLSSIDALLGCGVVLPKLCSPKSGTDGLGIVEEFASLGCMEQRTFLSALIYAINWFRELVNAFTFQKDQELQMKVMKRLMNIVELQDILVECLPQLPGYIPPPSQFLCPTSPPSFTSLGKDSKKGSKKNKRKRGVSNAKRSKKQVALTPAMATQDQEEADNGEEKEDDVEEDDAEESIEGEAFKVQRKELILSAMAPFFRELSVEVFVILRQEFVINPHPSSKPDHQRPTELGPAELHFLLEDYTLKLEHALPSNPLIAISLLGTIICNQGRFQSFSPLTARKTGSIFLNLDLHETKDIVVSAVSLLPCICEKLERVSEYFRDAIVNFDGVLDNPQMFLGHSPILARCFHLLLRDIGAILSWNGYGSLGTQGTRLLKEALSVVGGRLGAIGGPSQRTQTGLTVTHLAEESCSYIARFAEWIVRLPTAVALVSLLHRTTILADSHHSQREQLATVCRAFLSREWIGVDGLPEIGSAAAINLGHLMSSFLWASCSGRGSEQWESSNSPLAALHSVIKEVEVAAVDLEGNKDRLSVFPSITKGTFHVIYQALATWLVSVVREENIEPPPRATQRRSTEVRASQAVVSQIKPSQVMASQIKASQKSTSLDIKLAWWEIAVKCLYSLVKISKVQDSRRNLSTLLKKSLLLVNTFLSNGMPLFDKALCSHPKKVYDILREVQNSTRFLQHLCCDCKVKRDVGLTTHVPAVKRALEQLVHRVKEMLLKNNCAVAFWVGNLKNKNLRGEEIVSQAVSRTPSLHSEGESEEEQTNDENATRAESDDSDVTVSPPKRKVAAKRRVSSDNDSEIGSDIE